MFLILRLTVVSAQRCPQSILGGQAAMGPCFYPLPINPHWYVAPSENSSTNTIPTRTRYSAETQRLRSMHGRGMDTQADVSPERNEPASRPHGGPADE